MPQPEGVRAAADGSGGFARPLLRHGAESPTAPPKPPNATSQPSQPPECAPVVVACVARRYRSKKRFYLKFGVGFGSWLVSTPFFFLLTYNWDEYYRKEIMFVSENMVLFLAHAVYLLLYNPDSSYNQGFPFHSRTHLNKRANVKVATASFDIVMESSVVPLSIRANSCAGTERAETRGSSPAICRWVSFAVAAGTQSQDNHGWQRHWTKPGQAEGGGSAAGFRARPHVHVPP